MAFFEQNLILGRPSLPQQSSFSLLVFASSSTLELFRALNHNTEGFCLASLMSSSTGPGGLPDKLFRPTSHLHRTGGECKILKLEAMLHTATLIASCQSRRHRHAQLHVLVPGNTAAAHVRSSDRRQREWTSSKQPHPQPISERARLFAHLLPR